jgi:hypothetical protein
MRRRDFNQLITLGTLGLAFSNPINNKKNLFSSVVSSQSYKNKKRIITK